jgi:hypothetical protein
MYRQALGCISAADLSRQAAAHQFGRGLAEAALRVQGNCAHDAMKVFGEIHGGAHRRIMMCRCCDVKSCLCPGPRLGRLQRGVAGTACG